MKKEREKKIERDKKSLLWQTYLSIHVKDQLVPPRHVFFWLCWVVGVVLVFVFFGWVFCLLFSVLFIHLKHRDLRMLCAINKAGIDKIESTSRCSFWSSANSSWVVLVYVVFYCWFVVSSGRNLLAEKVWWTCAWMQGDALASYFTPFSLFSASRSTVIVVFCCVLWTTTATNNKQQHE